MSVVTGAYTVWVYIWEDANQFNQAAGEPTDATNWKIFGSQETMDTQDRDNNPERMYRPFDRAAEEILEQAFDGSWSADFTLTNTWWLQFAYGAPSTTAVDESGDGTTDYWEHTYTFDPRDPPKSAHLIEETHYPDGEVQQTIYRGCVASSIDADVSVEDVVGVSIDGAYALEETYSTADGDSLVYGDAASGIAEQPATQYRPLHFGNSYLRLDLDEDGTPEMKSLVQDASVSLEGNVELENELGTRFAAAPSYLNFEFDASYTGLVSVETKAEELKSAYGSQAVTQPQETMADADIDGELEFDAGLAGETNAVVFNLQGAFPDSFSRSNVGSPEDALEEDVDRMVANVETVVTSDQETPP